MDCRVFRCARQEEMYLYLRADLEPDELPPTLSKQLGVLSEVLSLELTEERKLARADAALVIAQLRSQGYYLQLPPGGLLNAHLYAGD